MADRFAGDVEVVFDFPNWAMANGTSAYSLIQDAGAVMRWGTDDIREVVRWEPRLQIAEIVSLRPKAPGFFERLWRRLRNAHEYDIARLRLAR